MRGILCAAAIFAAATTASQAADEIWVKSEHLKCVVDNIAVYRGEPTDPVLVIFERCPDPALDASALAALAVNQRLGDGGGVGGPAPALSLRKAELECLANPGVGDRLFASAENDLIRWPENVCKF